MSFGITIEKLHSSRLDHQPHHHLMLRCRCNHVRPSNRSCRDKQNLKYDHYCAAQHFCNAAACHFYHRINHNMDFSVNITDLWGFLYIGLVSALCMTIIALGVGQKASRWWAIPSYNWAEEARPPNVETLSCRHIHAWTFSSPAEPSRVIRKAFLKLKNSCRHLYSGCALCSAVLKAGKHPEPLYTSEFTQAVVACDSHAFLATCDLLQLYWTSQKCQNASNA